MVRHLGGALERAARSSGERYRACEAINRKAVCALAAQRPLSIVGASAPAATA